MRDRSRRTRTRAAHPGTVAAGRASGSSSPRLPPIPTGLVLALILLGAALLHRGALGLPFFADDYLFLEQVRGRSLLGALTAPDAISNFLRPVGRQLYFWLVGHLSGESPLAFHAVNLVLFVGIISLLFAIVRRLAGSVAAAVAAAFLALHYAADVPLRWVSGSQDLLALLGALGAIALYLAGRRTLAAAALLAALLAKETVVLTPLIAAVADRRPGERWRTSVVRAWPLALATVAWMALWLLTVPQRRGLGPSLGLEPLGALAVLAHLAHVTVGLEWRAGLDAIGPALPPLLPLVAVVLAVLAARPRTGENRDSRAALLAGGVWAVTAATPVIAVASVWSAYYYLFSLCGVALVLGAVAARGPRWMAVVGVVVLATGSQAGRAAPEFATGRGAWTWQSHINRLYIDRATDRIASYLAALKAARPNVPPRSTFFFAGVPSFVAWQTADGPLVRWAYRDTSLRSYYQSDFSLARARRGPLFFFAVADDSLREEVRQVGQLRGVALRVLLNDQVDAAHDVLVYLNEREPGAPDVLYFLAWLKWARGDTLAAADLLRRVDVAPDRGPAPEAARAAALRTAGDSTAAIAALMRGVQAHGLDPRLHALLADGALRIDPSDPQARVEALAARVLAPGDGIAWLRWGVIQAQDGRHSQAVRSLEHALALGIGDPTRTARVHEILTELRSMLPGGALAQGELHRALGSVDPPPGGGRSP
jgi:hypothetical protein